MKAKRWTSQDISQVWEELVCYDQKAGREKFFHDPAVYTVCLSYEIHLIMNCIYYRNFSIMSVKC